MCVKLICYQIAFEFDRKSSFNIVRHGSGFSDSGDDDDDDDDEGDDDDDDNASRIDL